MGPGRSRLSRPFSQSNGRKEGRKEGREGGREGAASIGQITMERVT